MQSEPVQFCANTPVNLDRQSLSLTRETQLAIKVIIKNR